MSIIAHSQKLQDRVAASEKTSLSEHDKEKWKVILTVKKVI